MSPGMAIQNPTRKLSWPVLLFSMSCLAIILAGLFVLEGRSRARRLETESGWPTVEARTELCSIIKFHSRMRGQSGDWYYVDCRFSYSVNGQQYRSDTRTTSTGIDVFGRSDELFRRMAEWVHQHRKGQWQVIHYDPADPSRISLAGADHEIEPQTAEVYYGAGRIMAMGGLALLIAAAIAGKVRDEYSAQLDVAPGTKESRPL